MLRTVIATAAALVATSAMAASISDGLWLSRDGETVLKFEPVSEDYPQLEGETFDMIILVS